MRIEKRIITINGEQVEVDVKVHETAALSTRERMAKRLLAAQEKRAKGEIVAPVVHDRVKFKDKIKRLKRLDEKHFEAMDRQSAHR